MKKKVLFLSPMFSIPSFFDSKLWSIFKFLLKSSLWSRMPGILLPISGIQSGLFSGQKIPLCKPVLDVTSKSHIDYIIAHRFKKASRRGFGYLSFTDLKRLSDYSGAFYPSERSLQSNDEMPLDP